MDAYILGLLAADGYTSSYEKKDGNISYGSVLELSEKQIIQDICSEYGLRVHHRKRMIAQKEREFWSVKFNNEIIGKYGKYLTKGRPNIKELYDSFCIKDKDEFVRGIFDGDGSIVFKTDKSTSYSDSKRKTVGFSVNSNCSDIKKIIEDFSQRHEIHISEYFNSRGSGAWYLSFNGKRSLKTMYEAFFKDEHSIKNKRKYDIFSDFYTQCCGK